MKQDIESSQIRLKNGWKHFDDLKIKGNTGDLNIRANNIHMLSINNNDVPNVYVDNNS